MDEAAVQLDVRQRTQTSTAARTVTTFCLELSQPCPMLPELIDSTANKAVRDLARSPFSDVSSLLSGWIHYLK